MEEVVLYIRNHRSVSAIWGLAAGLLILSPGLLFAMLLDYDIFNPIWPSALLFLSVSAGSYVLLAALCLLLAGFRGLVGIGYYGGWVLLGVLLTMVLACFHIEISTPVLTVVVVAPMIILKRSKDTLFERYAGFAGMTSGEEKTLIEQVKKSVSSIQNDNRRVDQKIRMGIMCYFDNIEGTDQYTAVNYYLYSRRRLVHHAMTRCMVISLKFEDDKEMVPRRYARRLHELSARIHRKGKSCFAGSLIDASQMSATIYLYYHPWYARSVFQWSAAWCRAMTHSFTVRSEKDPDWRHYYDDLRPDEYNFYRISNQRFYLYLVKKKFDFTKETSLWLLVAFPGTDAAAAAIVKLQEDGYILRIGPEEEEGLYYIIVEKTTRLGLERLNIMTDRVISSIQPWDGQLVSIDREDHFQKSYLRIAGSRHEGLSN